MPFTFTQVHAFATKFPDVTVGLSWRNRTWMVRDKGFIWERPLSKADITRLGDAPLPSGELLGVRTENLDAKDAILAMELPGFFTIQHFNNYPAVLIELRKARAADVRIAIESAYHAIAAKQPKRRPAATKATTKPKSKSTRRARKAR